MVWVRFSSILLRYWLHLVLLAGPFWSLFTPCLWWVNSQNLSWFNPRSCCSNAHLRWQDIMCGGKRDQIFAFPQRFMCSCCCWVQPDFLLAKSRLSPPRFPFKTLFPFQVPPFFLTKTSVPLFHHQNDQKKQEHIFITHILLQFDHHVPPKIGHSSGIDRPNIPSPPGGAWTPSVPWSPGGAAPEWSCPAAAAGASRSASDAPGSRFSVKAMELTGETPWKAGEIWWNMGWREGLGWFRVETSWLSMIIADDLEDWDVFQ